MIKRLRNLSGFLGDNRFIRRLSHGPPHICLIAPPVTRQSKSLPLGLLALGGALKARRISASLLDFNIAFLQSQDLIEERFFNYAREEIRKSGALLFGITALCANYPLALRLASIIKETVPGALVILGGPQASAVYEQTLHKFEAVDMVVVGEGEETLCELVECLHKGRDPSTIPGVGFRRGKDVLYTGARPLIKNLDCLPLPDYDLVDLTEYLDEELIDYLEFEAGRGCPFQCSFCSTSLMWKREFRAKSPERLLEEMTLLHKRYGINRFGFVHDNLTINPMYLKRLCDVLLANGSPYQWSLSASLNTIKPEILDTMRSAGCNGIFIGIESGSPRMQKLIKKHLYLEQAEVIVRRAHALGMRVDASFIIGFPEEERDDLNMTLKMAFNLRKLGAERVFLNLLAPLAGTPMCHEHRQELQLQGSGSSLATLPFTFEGVLPMIQKNPDIFSSFYVVPLPALEGIPLADLSTFMDEMIDWYTVAYDNLLEVSETLGLTPVEVFEKWHAWFLRSTGETGRAQSGKIFETFPGFLESYRQEVLKETGVKRYALQ